MGTRIDAWLDADATAAGTAFAEIEALFRDAERTLSRFDPHSELSRLNASAGQWMSVSKTLWSVLKAALDHARTTDGLFDPTVLGALRAAGYHRTFDEIGSGGVSEALPGPRQTGRWAEVRLDAASRAVWLPEGVGLDFGGIAKGYTAQWAARLLGLWGPGLIDAGGDLVAGAAPHGEEGWPVTVLAPRVEEREPDTPMVALRLADAALATSGVDHRRWTVEGRAAHHIIDPRTGTPAETDALLVSVLAPTGTEAEVWAKAALILGTQDGLARMTREGIPALMVDAGRALHVNAAMGQRIQVCDAPVEVMHIEGQPVSD